jgi:hypothetical protein
MPHLFHSNTEETMPVIRNTRLKLEMKEVLRHEGIRLPSKLTPEVSALLNELLASVENEHLLKPAIVYEMHDVAQVDHSGLRLKDNKILNGSIFSQGMSTAEELAVAVCTIGSNLEKRVSGYFQSNEPLRGVLLDGIGSAAIDLLARETRRLVTEKASARDYQASSPLNPGMSGFPISGQWQLFQLVPAEKIGVSLTSSGVMVPRKSISLVIGIGTQMKSWTQKEVCDRCTLKKTCVYRIQTQKEERDCLTEWAQPLKVIKTQQEQEKKKL